MKRGFRELPPRHQGPGAHPVPPYNLPIPRQTTLVPVNPEYVWGASSYGAPPPQDPNLVHDQLQRIKAAQACEIINSRVMMALEQQEKHEAALNTKKGRKKKGKSSTWSPHRTTSRGMKQQKRRRMMVPPGFGSPIKGSVVSQKNNSPNGGSHVRSSSRFGPYEPTNYSSNQKGYSFSRTRSRGGSLSKMRSKSVGIHGSSIPSNPGSVKTTWVPVKKHRLNPPRRSPPQPPPSPPSSPSSQSSSSSSVHPIGDTPIPGEGVTSKDVNHPRNKRMAPAHCNIQSVISATGGIYHPCHGYSTRRISIFDLFPGIVKYQSKRYGEADRIRFLFAQSQKPFCGVNGRPLGVDESEMWFIALKYLFNDITLGQFEYMTEEMTFLIKQYMSTHRKRRVFLTSIIRYGFLRVVSDLRKKLPRQEIKQQLAWEKRRKKKMMAMQQAKNKMMNHPQHQPMAPPPIPIPSIPPPQGGGVVPHPAAVPISSLHPSVTPLKLLSPEAASASPPRRVSNSRRQHKGLSLTYAPPPQFGGPGVTATMNNPMKLVNNPVATLQVGVPPPPALTPGNPLGNGKPKPLLTPSLTPGVTPGGNVNALPFEPINFNLHQRSTRSLRSQRSASAPYSMLPTAASSTYSQSMISTISTHSPMTGIGSHATSPRAPFIAPEMMSTVTSAAPYTSVGTLPTVPASRNDDDMDFEQIMSEIDKEMDFPELPPDEGNGNRNGSLSGDGKHSMMDKRKNVDLSLYVDAMEFVPAAQKECGSDHENDGNDHSDEMKDGSTPTTGTDHPMATVSPQSGHGDVGGNGNGGILDHLCFDQDAEMKMEELTEQPMNNKKENRKGQEEEKGLKGLHKSNKDLYGEEGTGCNDGDDLNVYAMLFANEQPFDDEEEEKTQSNESRESEEVKHNEQNESQLVLMNLDDRKVSEEPMTAPTTCNTISSGTPATGSSNEELRECTPDKKLTKGLWDAISGVNNDSTMNTGSDAPRMMMWGDDDRNHGHDQDEDLDDQKEIDLAMVDMNACNDNARAMIDGPKVCFSDLSDVPASAAKKDGEFVATVN